QSTDPSFVSLTLRDFKVSSFFSGMGSNYIGASNYIVALILRRDENPEKFKNILKKAAAKILKHIEKGEVNKLLPEVFNEMKKVGR
ncbi:MAG: hypothetical protein ACTSWR_02480, partial [Candidatus Helarchaeota archaeon]